VRKGVSAREFKRAVKARIRTRIEACRKGPHQDTHWSAP